LSELTSSPCGGVFDTSGSLSFSICQLVNVVFPLPQPLADSPLPHFLIGTPPGPPGIEPGENFPLFPSRRFPLSVCRCVLSSPSFFLQRPFCLDEFEGAVNFFFPKWGLAELLFRPDYLLPPDPYVLPGPPTSFLFEVAFKLFSAAFFSETMHFPVFFSPSRGQFREVLLCLQLYCCSPPRPEHPAFPNPPFLTIFPPQCRNLSEFPSW